MTVTVDEDDLLSDNNVSHLNGNQTSNGTDGTRPNEDDFVWTFTCIQHPGKETPAMPLAGRLLLVALILAMGAFAIGLPLGASFIRG